MSRNNFSKNEFWHRNLNFFCYHSSAWVLIITQWPAQTKTPSTKCNYCVRSLCTAHALFQEHRPLSIIPNILLTTSARTGSVRADLAGLPPRSTTLSTCHILSSRPRLFINLPGNLIVESISSYCAYTSFYLWNSDRNIYITQINHDWLMDEGGSGWVSKDAAWKTFSIALSTTCIVWFQEFFVPTKRLKSFHFEQSITRIFSLSICKKAISNPVKSHLWKC